MKKGRINWELCIAIAALILSQFNPVLSYWPNKDIDFFVGGQAQIISEVGLIGIGVPIELKNKGNREVTINEIELKLKGPSGTESNQDIYAFTSMTNSANAQSYSPFGRIFVDPDREWNNYGLFRSDSETSANQKLQDLRRRFVEDLSVKQERLPEGNSLVVSVDPKLVDEANILFDDNFALEPGLYAIKVIAVTDDLAEDPEISLEFELNQNHIDLFQSQRLDYKLGTGVASPTSPFKRVFVNLSESS